VAGLFGIATMIREMSTLGATVSPLLNCTDIDYVVKPMSPHFDLITATRAILQQCSVTWITHHVLGHQDDNLDALHLGNVCSFSGLVEYVLN
jgi:hypothetical protein